MNDFNKNINGLCAKFKALKGADTKALKERLMAEFNVDEEFNKAMIYLLDINKVSGIKKKKLNKKLKFDKVVVFNKLSELLDFILDRPTAPDAVVFCVQYFLKHIEDEESKSIISDIITKDYKCGVTDLTAYGFIPGLERNWRERKGHSLIDNKTGEITTKKIKDKNIIVSLKLDGYRCKIIKRSDDDIVIKSASGKTIEDMTEILKDAKRLPNGIYDGECQAIGEFENSTARFNATSKIITKDGEKTGLEIVVFDYIEENNIKDYFDYKSIKVQKKDRMKKAEENIPKNLKTIRYIPVYFFDKKADEELINNILNKYEEVVNNGEEGLIIDISDSYYERSKGNTMFKLKPELTGDFKVIELTEGTGKQKGMLGAFIIEYKGNTVNVGSGITDSIRKEVWSNKDFYIDKLIEVKYFGETQDEKTELLSLRLPRFKRFRHDKTDISYD